MHKQRKQSLSKSNPNFKRQLVTNYYIEYSKCISVSPLQNTCKSQSLTKKKQSLYVSYFCHKLTPVILFKFIYSLSALRDCPGKQNGALYNLHISESHLKL